MLAALASYASIAQRNTPHGDLDLLRTASGGKDVTPAAGANVAQQYLAAGLVDQMDLNLEPLFLGRGERLFENLASKLPRLELVRAVPAPGVTHLRYRLG